MTTSSQHIEQVVEELQRKRYDYMRWAITGDGDGNKIAEETDTLVRHALTTHAALVEAETVERCARVVEQELSEQKIDNGHDCYDTKCDYCENATKDSVLSDAAAAIRALQGKNEKI